MYETSGEHCYNVTMKWSAAGNTVGQSAIGHAVVYDRKVLPPPVAVFRLRDRERLHAPCKQPAVLNQGMQHLPALLRQIICRYSL